MKKTNEELLIESGCEIPDLLENDEKVTVYYPNLLDAMDAAVKQRNEEIEPLIIAMNDYITVLGRELDDCAVMLSVHGWQSKRVQEGIDARNKISEIKKSLKP